MDLKLFSLEAGVVSGLFLLYQEVFHFLPMFPGVAGHVETARTDRGALHCERPEKLVTGDELRLSFPEFSSNKTMKYVSASLITVLTLTAFSVGAAPLPDPSKLPPVSKQEGVTYEKDIHPIFEDACMRCHGDQRPRANLRLDTLDGVLKGSKDGKVVASGHSEMSKLVFAVSEINGKISMPPKPRPPRAPMAANGDTNAPAAPMTPPPPAHPWKPLTVEQVGLIRAWIDQGAK